MFFRTLILFSLLLGILRNPKCSLARINTYKSGSYQNLTEESLEDLEGLLRQIELSNEKDQTNGQFVDPDIMKFKYWDWSNYRLLVHKADSSKSSEPQCLPPRTPVRHLRLYSLQEAVDHNEDRFSWGSDSDQIIMVYGDPGFVNMTAYNQDYDREEDFCNSTVKTMVVRSDRMIYKPDPTKGLPRRVKWRQSVSSKPLCHLRYPRDTGHMKFPLLFENELKDDGRDPFAWMWECQSIQVPDYSLNRLDGEGIEPRYTTGRKGDRMANKNLPETYNKVHAASRTKPWGWSRYPPRVLRWKKPDGDWVSKDEHARRHELSRQALVRTVPGRRAKKNLDLFALFESDEDESGPLISALTSLDNLLSYLGGRTLFGKIVLVLMTIWSIYWHRNH